MPIELSETATGNVLEVQASGKLTHADYQRLETEVRRRLKEHDKINVLFEMVDFKGWELAGFWDDIKFDVKHFADVDRFAMVGEWKWEKNLTELSRPFTGAEVRYFDRSEIAEARRWLSVSAGRLAASE